MEIARSRGAGRTKLRAFRLTESNFDILHGLMKHFGGGCSEGDVINHLLEEKGKMVLTESAENEPARKKKRA